MPRVFRLVVTLLVVLSTSLGAQPIAPDFADVSYSPASLGPHQLRTLDVYQTQQPVPANGAPCVLWVHGGGGVTGDKAIDVTGDPWQSLLDAGITVVAINYPLAGPTYAAYLAGDPNGGDADPTNDYEVHPDTVRDVALAIEFVRSEAPVWSVDADRIALIGDSAGSFLGGLAGLLDDGSWTAGHTWSESSRIDVFVNYRGVTNLTLPNCCVGADVPAFGIFTADPGQPPAGFHDPSYLPFKEQTSPSIQAVTPANAPFNRLLRARHVYGGVVGGDIHDPVNGEDFQQKLESIGNITSTYVLYASAGDVPAADFGPPVVDWLKLQLRSRPYGGGLAASVAHPPVLALVSEGATQNLRIGHCPPGALTLTVAGTGPQHPPIGLLGGWLHIVPFSPLVTVSVSANMAGDAFLSVDLSPLDIQGVELYLQSFVADSAAPEGFAISNGLALYPR